MNPFEVFRSVNCLIHWRFERLLEYERQEHIDKDAIAANFTDEEIDALAMACKFQQGVADSERKNVERAAKILDDQNRTVTRLRNAIKAVLLKRGCFKDKNSVTICGRLYAYQTDGGLKKVKVTPLERFERSSTHPSSEYFNVTPTKKLREELMACRNEIRAAEKKFSGQALVYERGRIMTKYVDALTHGELIEPPKTLVIN